MVQIMELIIAKRKAKGGATATSLGAGAPSHIFGLIRLLLLQGVLELVNQAAYLTHCVNANTKQKFAHAITHTHHN